MSSLPSSSSELMPWFGPLMDAESPHEVARLIVEVLRPTPQHRAWVVSALDSASAGRSHYADADPLSDDDLTLLRAALAANTPRLSQGDPLRLALPLPRSRSGIVIALADPAEVPALLERACPRLPLIDRRFGSVLQVEHLQHAMKQLEHSEQVQRALFAISDLAGSDRDMSEVLRGVHAIVGTLMYAENFYIVTQDTALGTMRFLYFADVEDSAPDDELPLPSYEHTLTGYLLSEGKPLRGDADQLKAQVPGPLRAIGTASHDWMGVPMIGDGQVRGAIVLQSYRPGSVYSQADQALLEFVGSHILTAMDRKRSTVDLERNVALRTQQLAEANHGLQLEIVERQRAERLQRALFQIAQLATADLDEEACYRAIHGIVGELLNAQNFYIALLSQDRRYLQFPYYIDSQRDAARSGRPIARGLTEYVLRHRHPLLVSHDEIAELARQGEIDAATAGPFAMCWLGAPLFHGDEVIGLVTVQSYDPAVSYGPADLELLGFVASQIANSLHRRRATQLQQRAYAQLEERVLERTRELRSEIVERERVQGQLEHEVMHDALTGLPNRGYLRDRLTHLLAQLRREPAAQCALLYLDVDRFKVINDSLGHLAGDAVLKEVARRMQSCVREPDLVARLAGDEFVILLENVESAAAAIKIAQRVLDLLSTPVTVAGKVLSPSASVGIAVSTGAGADADELLRDADIALYRAKAMGRNRYVLFDASLQRQTIDVLALEGELREALQGDQFEPYFQPIVRLADATTVGYEALLRWRHPERGILGPPDFLQVAEDCGVIEAIDWRMFALSCAQAARLPGDHFLTINVSPRHFRDEHFDHRLLDLLAHSGLAPTSLLTEVTEGSMLDDPARVRATLARLQQAGIGAALDDFGTGYSSLSYLHTFSLKMLKIDRAFVAELDNPGASNSGSILAAILALARALGMDVVAEGIETPEQHRLLIELGCQYGQGFLLGRPAPASHWLAAAIGVATP